MVDLLADLHNVNVLWQVAVLALSLAVAWWVARLVRGRAHAHPDPPSPSATSRSASAESAGCLFRFRALVCVILGRFVLHRFQPEVDLLNVAVPLLFSLLLVRIAVYVLHQRVHAEQPAALLGAHHRLDHLDRRWRCI